MSNIMERNLFAKQNSTCFTLENVTPPILCDMGYEMYPAGYLSFPCYGCYKKIKKINKNISIFLKRRREMSNKKVLKCLELIESLIDIFSSNESWH